jgi:uncharacterized repeat protein (TIGR02543 family)
MNFPRISLPTTSVRQSVAGLVRRTPLRRFMSVALIAVLAVVNLSLMASPARAIAIDASAAAFNFHYATNGTLLSGTTPKDNGAVVKFSNITGSTIPGVSIDAIVETELSSGTIDNYDNPGQASNNAEYFQIDGKSTVGKGTMGFNFAFCEGGTYTGVGTGTPITLQNVSITSIDLDGTTAFCQFSDFTSFQSYYVADNTNLDIQTNATDSSIPLGVTRFMGTSCVNGNLNIVEDAIQVQYDSVTTFSVKFGADRVTSGGYFGIAFSPLSEVFDISQPAGELNPANQPPSSTDTTRTVTMSQPSVIQLEDFGDFEDPDGNPFERVKITALPGSGSLQKFVNGNWVSVSLNDEILVSDISNGNVRFTGSADTSLQFKVSDGSSYSNSAYTMTLLVADQPQTITFDNPGTKTPTSGAFASGATASSDLTVTLTSLTPGVCTVSGLNIEPVSSGTCTIVASQAGNDDYSAATSVTQTFPISSLEAQEITAPNPGTKTYTGSPSTFTVSPTADSSLTVSLISLSPSVCTVSGFDITIVGPGNCTIRHVQAGNVTYAPAPPVEYTFVVNSPVTEYTLFYDGNENTGGTVPGNQTGNGNVTLATNSGSLERDGFIFKGWNTEPNGSGIRYLVSSTYNLSGDVTLFAEWDPIPAITYDPNGATGGETPDDIPLGSSVTIDPNSGNLVRTGYEFVGWNTEPDGTGTRYLAGMTPTLPEGTVLYAEWKPLSAGLPNTGLDVTRVLPLALALLAAGAILTTRRMKLKKRSA